MELCDLRLERAHNVLMRFGRELLLRPNTSDRPVFTRLTARRYDAANLDGHKTRIGTQIQEMIKLIKYKKELEDKVGSIALRDC